MHHIRGVYTTNHGLARKARNYRHARYPSDRKKLEYVVFLLSDLGLEETAKTDIGRSHRPRGSHSRASDNK